LTAAVLAALALVMALLQVDVPQSVDLFVVYFSTLILTCILIVFIIII